MDVKTNKNIILEYLGKISFQKMSVDKKLPTM